MAVRIEKRIPVTSCMTCMILSPYKTDADTVCIDCIVLPSGRTLRQHCRKHRIRGFPAESCELQFIILFNIYEWPEDLGISSTEDPVTGLNAEDYTFSEGERELEKTLKICYFRFRTA